MQSIFKDLKFKPTLTSKLNTGLYEQLNTGLHEQLDAKKIEQITRGFTLGLNKTSAVETAYKNLPPPPSSIDVNSITSASYIPDTSCEKENQRLFKALMQANDRLEEFEVVFRALEDWEDVFKVQHSPAWNSGIINPIQDEALELKLVLEDDENGGSLGPTLNPEDTGIMVKNPDGSHQSNVPSSSVRRRKGFKNGQEGGEKPRKNGKPGHSRRKKINMAK
jgi:hypothetical protein